ncbi:MAG: ribonuclease P protein component [Oscillospiraceae bacterium]
MKLKFFTINDNKVFQRVYKKGESFVSPVLVTYFLKNKCGYLRVGITASKKIGKSCKRNRAKRIVRESFRLFLKQKPHLIDIPFDIIFVTRSKTTRVKMDIVKKSLEAHFNKKGF